MTEYIKRKEAENAIHEAFFVHGFAPQYFEAVHRLCEVASADVVERKRGEWYDRGSLSCRCSNCGCKSTKEYNFCPHCGADMRGRKDG